MQRTLYPHSLTDTIGHMYRMIHKYTPEASGFGWQTLFDVYDGVRAVRYVRDEEAPECAGAAECLKRPTITRVLGGDCDDKVILAGAALNALGIPFRIVTAGYHGPDMEHTYLEVHTSGQWLPFDATYPHQQIFQEQPYTVKQVWP